MPEMITVLNRIGEASVMEFMTPAEYLDPQVPLSQVIGLMGDSNAYEAFIEENERTAIITIRDILDTRDITKTKISNLMHYVPRLNRNNTVSDAAGLMFEHRIRSLPVHENSRLKGQISAISIVRELMRNDSKVRIGNIMTPNPICLDSDDTVSKARSIMIRRKIDQLPVLKNGKLRSAITSASIVFNTLPKIDRGKKGGRQVTGFNVSVENFSDPDVTWNDAKDSPREVFENMARNRGNYSIITNFEEVQGIVTYRDFMKLLVEKTELEMPMYIVGLPEDPFEAEAAKEKFSRIARLFHRAVPNLSEARAIIKAGKSKSARTRYEVQVFVKSPVRQYSYKGYGFELPDVFDQVDSWAKGVVGRSVTGRKRVRVDPGVITESTEMK